MTLSLPRRKNPSACDAMYYRLVGRVPVPCRDYVEWNEWFAHVDGERVVAQTEVLGAVISTVFTGIDRNYLRGGEPLLFETVIFDSAGGRAARKQHTTWDEAARSHGELVTELLAATQNAVSITDDMLAAIHERFIAERK